MRGCSAVLVMIVLLCAGLAATAAAGPVLVDDQAGAFGLTAGRVVWDSNAGLASRSRGVARVLTRDVGVDGSSVSSNLVAWQEAQSVGGHVPTVTAFREAVLLPSGRVVDVVRCTASTRSCGCVRPTSVEDLLDPLSRISVDGDRVAIGRTGCSRGVTIYERVGNRLRRRASLARASTAFDFRGRYLSWESWRNDRVRSITLYDWKRDRIVQRFRHIPFAGGDITPTLGPGGQILVRAQRSTGIGGVTVLLRRDGSRERIRGIAEAVFAGPHRLQSVTAARVGGSGEPVGSLRRVEVDLLTGHRTRLPVVQPGPTTTGFAYDGRCLAWKTESGALWIDSIDGRPSRAPACGTRSARQPARPVALVDRRRADQAAAAALLQDVR
jgi:hypothetical protein